MAESNRITAVDALEAAVLHSKAGVPLRGVTLAQCVLVLEQMQRSRDRKAALRA